jgi:bacillithiol system protein YtxJ
VQPARIADLSALERALASEHHLLFKHSPICPISARAFAEYRRFLAAHPGTPSGWIDVIDQRSLSEELARRTGVRHESPQAIWVRYGEVAWHASHGAVHQASLEAASQARGAGGASGA